MIPDQFKLLPKCHCPVIYHCSRRGNYKVAEVAIEIDHRPPMGRIEDFGHVREMVRVSETIEGRIMKFELDIPPSYAFIAEKGTMEMNVRLCID